MPGSQTIPSPSEAPAFPRSAIVAIVLALVLGPFYLYSLYTFKSESKDFILEARLAEKSALALPGTIVLQDSAPEPYLLARGWANRGKAFTWTNGSRSLLVLPIEPTPNQRIIKITITSPRQYLVVENQSLNISCRANGQLIDTRELSKSTPFEISHTFTLPANSDRVEIEFHVSGALSPFQAGKGGYTKPLGLAISEISLSPADS